MQPLEHPPRSLPQAFSRVCVHTPCFTLTYLWNRPLASGCGGSSESDQYSGFVCLSTKLRVYGMWTSIPPQKQQLIHGAQGGHQAFPEPVHRIEAGYALSYTVSNYSSIRPRSTKRSKSPSSWLLASASMISASWNNGLTDGQEYKFRVRETLGEANGEWSETVRATPGPATLASAFRDISLAHNRCTNSR